jgi:hypothetical protein
MTKEKTVKKEVIVKSSILPDLPTKEVSPDVEAVVYNGSYIVRKYSLETHGEKFVELAKEFASKRKFVVNFEKIKHGIKYPSCGHIIEQNTL